MFRSVGYDVCTLSSNHELFVAPLDISTQGRNLVVLVQKGTSAYVPKDSLSPPSRESWLSSGGPMASFPETGTSGHVLVGTSDPIVSKAQLQTLS